MACGTRMTCRAPQRPSPATPIARSHLPTNDPFVAGQALRRAISASARGRADCRMPPTTGTVSTALREADPLEVPVSSTALGGRQSIHGCSRLSLAGMLFGSLPPAGSDPAPAPHQHHTPKQVALDHHGVEPMYVGVSLDPSQDEHMPDG